MVAGLVGAVVAVSPTFAQQPRATVNGEVFKGHAVMVDLPRGQRVKNHGAPNFPYMGLCVFASIDMAARWQNVRPLIGIIDKIPYGGGWPGKVDDVMKRYAPSVPYYQYEGADMRYIEQALDSGRVACVTYGWSERYGKTIAHMVCCVYLDKQWACVLDNNFIDSYEWMPRAEFERRIKHPGSTYWTFVLLTPPPPPVPTN